MVITMLSIPFPEDEKQTNSNFNIPQPRCWKLKKNRRRGQGTWNELICDQLFGEPERNCHGMAVSSWIKTLWKHTNKITLVENQVEKVQTDVNICL